MDMITNIGLEFKLTNFASFGESVFLIGFIRKTIKVDPNVRFNRNYP
jgi:hypothetical protein